jgi:hypothetical protein
VDHAHSIDLALSDDPSPDLLGPLAVSGCGRHLVEHAGVEPRIAGGAALAPYEIASRGACDADGNITTSRSTPWSVLHDHPPVPAEAVLAATGCSDQQRLHILPDRNGAALPGRGAAAMRNVESCRRCRSPPRSIHRSPRRPGSSTASLRRRRGRSNLARTGAPSSPAGGPATGTNRASTSVPN